MKYDFDKAIDRTGTNSIKWNFNKKIFGYEDVLPMWVADMDFETVPEVKEEIIKRAKHGIYGYSDRMESYLESITGWMKKRHDWVVEKDWVVSSPGIVTALHHIVKAFTHPGDKVIVQPPVYSPFYSAAIKNGCSIVTNPLSYTDGKYRMDFEDLQNKVKDPRVKMMILCSPHNPVGRVWTQEELETLGEICLSHGVLIVSDEIHSDLIYKGYKHCPFPLISESFAQNTITCTAPSKTFNLAGLQTSNIIIPNSRLRSNFNISMENSGVPRSNLFGNIACEAAYTYGEEWLEELLAYLGANKEFVREYIGLRLPQIKFIEPEGTYLLWLDCRGLGMNRRCLKEFMLSKAKVALNEGSTFMEGGEGFQRINIACPRPILQEGMKRIENAIKNLPTQ